MKKIFLLFIFMLMPLFAQANNIQIMPENDELYAVNSIEDIEKDLTKRFILGVFGKDALVYFLPAGADPSLADTIKSLSDAEVERLSRPFNSSIISGTLILISAFFLVALVTFIFYIIWVYIESLFRTQDSGEFLGGKWNKVLTPIKVIIGFALIFPMWGQSHAPFNKLAETSSGWNIGAFSLSQLGVFMAAGASNQSANIIFGEFVRAMPKHYPAIKMPNVTSKSKFMSDVIDFMVCAKSSHQQEMNLTFRRFNTDESSLYKMSARAGKCEITGQIGYDEATVNDLKTNNNLINLVGNINYESMQKAAIQTATQNLFSQASDIADSIIRADKSIHLLRSDLQISPSSWRNECSNIASKATTDLNKEGLITFNYYASNCLSKNFIEDLSKASVSTAYIYSNQNYLKGNNIELCTHGGTLDANGEKPLTYVKAKESEYIFGDRYKMIGDCVKQVCSGTNIYECASAINFAKEIEEKEKIAKMGWITGGANAYKLFSGTDNANARSIINKSSFSNGYVDDTSAFIDLGYENKGVLDSFTVSVNAVPPVSYDYSDFSDYIETKETFYDQTVIDNTRTGSFMDGGSDGWFGVGKLQNCVENPMKISNGYVCGTVTEEVHLFGSKLIALGLQVKMISLLTTTQKGKNNKKVGTVSNKAKAFTTNAVKVVDQVAPAAFTTFLLSQSLVSNDSFTEVDQEIWQQYPEVVGFASAALVGGYSSENPISNAVTKMLDILTAVLIVLGILFGFVMPLLPFGLWMVAIGGWVIALLEALVLAPIWGVVLVAPSKDHTADAARKSTIIIVSILLKAPLLTVGLVIAWLLNNVLLSELLTFSDISSALALQPSEFIKGLIDQFIVLIVYFIMLYGIYNIIFSLIESFNDVAIDVLFGGKGISPFAQKQRGENWRSSVGAATAAISKK